MWSRIYFIPLLKTVQKLYTPRNYTLQNHHLYYHSRFSLLQKIFKNPDIYRELSPQHRQRCCPVDLVQSAPTWPSREQSPTKTPPTHSNRYIMGNSPPHLGLFWNSRTHLITQSLNTAKTKAKLMYTYSNEFIANHNLQIL